MNTYRIFELDLPVCGELTVGGHSIPILDMKELPDKLREEPGEARNDLSH